MGGVPSVITIVFSFSFCSWEGNVASMGRLYKEVKYSLKQLAMSKEAASCVPWALLIDDE